MKTYLVTTKTTLVETGNAKAPISFAAASAKRGKMTGPQFKAAKAQATAITGYGPSSPIWGKQILDVISMIEIELTAAQMQPDPLKITFINNAAKLLNELKSRTLTRKLIGQIGSGS